MLWWRYIISKFEGPPFITTVLSQMGHFIYLQYFTFRISSCSVIFNVYRKHGMLYLRTEKLNFLLNHETSV